MAVTFAPVRPVTDDELLELSERNPGYQFERTAKGELIVTPTGGESGRREFALATQFGPWAAANGQGIAFSPTTMFILPDSSRLIPDASWVRRDVYDRLSTEQRRGWLALCPDVAFEIRSETQSAAELREKMRVYLANGARLAVFIDPYGRIVEVCRPGQEPKVHHNPATVALDPELPGSVLELAPIFGA